MAATAKPTGGKQPQQAAATFKPYVPETVSDMPEFTLPAVLTGAILGLIFSASSMYLVLKVGMTVSASIPIAVLSVSLFRAFSKVLGVRKATILENNMVQTTGSAGESIAFGVGVTMPALMLLGFEMDLVRVMTVAVLGGLLGILMMIPLRRAFIVKQHGELAYPEGTACADVLKAGEVGGSSAFMVFLGFIVAGIVKALMAPLHIISEGANWSLFSQDPGGPVKGLNKGVLGGEFTPELLGVGYIIGPRIASITVAGGLLAYLVILPAIATFGANASEPVYPSTKLISQMSVGELRNSYILYIGAGAVATGGLISMGRALPVIIASIVAGLRDLAGSARGGANTAGGRTERDLSMGVVLIGSLLLVVLLALSPKLGLGMSAQGLLGAGLVLVFGFLFVTVSSRLTGEIGSSSNPISGMTVATLLFTCLIFLLLGRTSKADTLTALTIAAVVCISASNGGTTAQDLKTGYLVGATPRWQQIGILIGALTSAIVIGATILMMNNAGTHYTKRTQYLPDFVVPESVLQQLEKQKVGRPYKNEDPKDYFVLYAAEGEFPGVLKGKYLVDETGAFRYREDPAINGLEPYDDKELEIKEAQDRRSSGAAAAAPKVETAASKAGTAPTDDRTSGEGGAVLRNVDQDETGDSAANSTTDSGTVDSTPAPADPASVPNRAPLKLQRYDAPKTQLMALIIDGVLNQKLPWSLVLIGALIALTLELCGVPALPFAVGIYLPIQISFPIFIGGAIRWIVDKINPSKEEQSDSSPGVLLCSGYIAGGTLLGVAGAFVNMSDNLVRRLNLAALVNERFGEGAAESRWAVMGFFGLMCVILFVVGTAGRFAKRNGKPEVDEDKED